VGDLGEPRETVVVEAAVAELELEVRDDRDEVRVAAALAVAVDRALDVGRPASTPASVLATRTGVVVAVDAQPASPAAPAATSAWPRAIWPAASRRWCRSTDRLGARLGRRAQAAQRVVGVVA
jgi:hypothetical protein